jgi:hypothetical protein
MTPTTPQQGTTIDSEEPAREVERAAEMFVRGEHGMERTQAISSLRVAVELILAILPHSTRYQAERAVSSEFLIRVESKLDCVHDAADVLRQARKQLNETFPTRN